MVKFTKLSKGVTLQSLTGKLIEGPLQKNPNVFFVSNKSEFANFYLNIEQINTPLYMYIDGLKATRFYYSNDDVPLVKTDLLIEFFTEKEVERFKYLISGDNSDEKYNDFLKIWLPYEQEKILDKKYKKWLKEYIFNITGTNKVWFKIGTLVKMMKDQLHKIIFRNYENYSTISTKILRCFIKYSEKKSEKNFEKIKPYGFTPNIDHVYEIIPVLKK